MVLALSESLIDQWVSAPCVTPTSQHVASRLAGQRRTLSPSDVSWPGHDIQHFCYRPVDRLSPVCLPIREDAGKCMSSRSTGTNVSLPCSPQGFLYSSSRVKLTLTNSMQGRTPTSRKMNVHREHAKTLEQKYM